MTDITTSNHGQPAAADHSRRRFIGQSGGLLAGSALGGLGSAASAQAAGDKPGRFNGKVAVITGGARGVGRACAEQLAREGADIVLCDVPGRIESLPYPLATEADLLETQRRIESHGRRCLAEKGDVRDAAVMQALIDRTAKEFGRVDFLIANAAIINPGAIATLSDSAWNDVIQTNLHGVFYSIRAALPQMIKQNYGRIVVISSMAGRSGIPQMAHYCASKWGVIGLAKGVALEVARQGITVNAVCPTSIGTDMIINEAAFRHSFPDRKNLTREEYISLMRSNPSLPQGIPWVEPEDVANAALFLLSEEARFITGEAVSVSAGTIATNSA